MGKSGRCRWRGIYKLPSPLHCLLAGYARINSSQRTSTTRTFGRNLLVPTETSTSTILSPGAQFRYALHTTPTRTHTISEQSEDTASLRQFAKTARCGSRDAPTVIAIQEAGRPRSRSGTERQAAAVVCFRFEITVNKETPLQPPLQPAWRS